MMIFKNLPLCWRLPTLAYGLAALMLIGCDREVTRPEFVRKAEWVDSGVWMKVDTHIHTTFSDGAHSVSVVAAKAREFGCDAIAITDHGDQNLTAASPEYAEAIEVARREHPELLILAGLEWNVPPWKGDTHATVLMPGGSDEFLQLADFKAQFDDFERTDRTEHLAEQAIRWLESVETADDSRPVVILNHPSRKTDSAVEAGQQFQTILDDSVVTIGFEGAPGHQKGKELGAYKGPVMPIDRWDPVAAEVGGIWDQQLGSGSDVWAALATSDFHQEGDDYWPGEFSETWVYAPERTSAGLLSALRAGSFFGSHGGIVREIELSVAADGLERPARAGEVIRVAAGGSVEVRLTGEVPELDWSGQPNHLDAVELIVVTTDGVRSIEVVDTTSSSGRLDVIQQLEVPASGLVVRARGRRIVADGPDLMFYTNPIRIEATQSARDSSGVSASSITNLLSADVLRRVAGGGILLLVLISVVASFRGKPRTDFEPVSTNPMRLPTRVHYLGLTIAFTMIAIYGSLVPLEYEPISFADALARFRAVPFIDLNLDQRADWVANILLFVPIAFCGMGTAAVDTHGRLRKVIWGLITIMACTGLSVALEFTQIWFPQRTVSQNDMIAESLGGVAGMMIWVAAGQVITDWTRRYTGAASRKTHIDWILQAYVVGLLIYSVMPLDLTIHPAELFRKYRDGRIVLIPFWTYDFGPEAIWSRLSGVLVFLPVGAFATRAWTSFNRLRSMRDSVLLGVMVVCLTEICQIFVYSRYAETTDLITGTMGVWLGVWFTQRLCKTSTSAPQAAGGELRGRLLWGFLAIVYSVVLCVIFWWPLSFVRDKVLIAERMEGYFRVPFASMYWGSEFNAVTQLLRKSLLFSVLGFLLVRLINPAVVKSPIRRVLVAVAAVYSFGLGVLIELVQCAIPSHVADITDSILYGGGACLGMFITLRILHAEPDFHRHAVDDLRTGVTGPARVRSGIVPWVLGGVITLIGLGFLATALRTSGPDTESFESSARDSKASREPGTVADRWGTVFLPFAGDLQLAPKGSEISVPDFAGSYAIWGATGRDDRGHIWFGVSAEGVEIPSAHLFEYIPDSGQTIDRGSVVTELKRCGVYRRGEGQMKIHSKIVQADDGYLYFASMDEQGEKDDGSVLPQWGSHFWRLRPQEATWEHLAAVPEGLIAVAGTGQWIYALGLFDHVLYQYDTQQALLRSVRIGSVGGHVSRNLLSDLRGHVYVPRLKQTKSPPKGGNSKSLPQIAVTLVELDTDLHEVSSTPLEHYRHNDIWNDHGIVSCIGLADESLVFATSVGFLYRIIPATNGPAAVEPIGWFHPDGPAYSPTLFALSGERYVAGVARRAGHAWEWVVHDLESGISTASSADFAQEQPTVRGDLLLYGSATRDRFGDLYIAGRYLQAGAQRPILLRLKPQAR